MNLIFYQGYCRLKNVQVKVDIRDVPDLSKLAKYCKLTVLESELDEAFKKADNFGIKNPI